MNRGLSTLALLMSLNGCASVQTVCPETPPLTARVPLGESFQQQMQLFLQGSLPEPTSSEQP